MKTPIAELSRDQRFEVYKKALNVCIEKDPMTEDNIGFGLCLLLPCLYWGLSHYLQKSPEGEGEWLLDDTPILFPEVSKWISYCFYCDEGGSLDAETIDEKRIEFLQKLINDYENETK